MDLESIRAVAAHEVNRRKLIQGLGLAAGAGVLGLTTSDPVYAATTGYDLANGYVAGSYQAPRGITQKSPAKDTALAWINDNSADLTKLSDQIWGYAELSLREWQSALAVANILSRNGFKIEWGTAGLPAAFIATFQQGSGGPVLGFNGEYDALPGLSQRQGSSQHDPVIYNYDAYAPTYGPGHGDAHNTLGAATAGAAIATAKALRKTRLNATLKYFGSSGEEQLIGKAYAVRDGYYNGLDVFLDWHPGPTTDASWVPLATLTSATFTFLGAAGHGGSPLGNKSGLDGALLMAHMTEYLRQNNIAPSARMHYAIVNGGGGPNVAPDLCSIWYYVREGSPERTKILYDKVVKCAEAAASASQTKLTYRLNSSIWNTLGNKAGAEIVNENMLTIGPPTVGRKRSSSPKRCNVSLVGPISDSRRASFRLPRRIRRSSADRHRMSVTSAGSRRGSASSPRSGHRESLSITGRPPRPAAARSLMPGCWRPPSTSRPLPSIWSCSPICSPRCGPNMPSARRAPLGRVCCRPTYSRRSTSLPQISSENRPEMAATQHHLAGSADHRAGTTGQRGPRPSPDHLSCVVAGAGDVDRFRARVHQGQERTRWLGASHGA